MLQGVLIALAVMVVSWAVLVVLAARLPPGLLKDLAAFLPACVTFTPAPAPRSARAGLCEGCAGGRCALGYLADRPYPRVPARHRSPRLRVSAHRERPRSAHREHADRSIVNARVPVRSSDRSDCGRARRRTDEGETHMAAPQCRVRRQRETLCPRRRTAPPPAIDGRGRSLSSPVS